MSNVSSNGNGEGQAQWNSRFGYLMVAAGAAIGLGNIWKFPYLAYRGGGGIFLIIYIVIVCLMAKPMVEMETAIGRYSKADTVTAFEAVNKKWGFVGWIANLCTLMINMFYVVVGGWVLKYAAQYVVSGDFGEDKLAFFNNFVESPVEPIIWALILLVFVSFMLLFGITNIVEKLTKVIMPALFVLLVICGIWALFANDGAVEGLKYYLLPDFSKFNFKVFADAATEVLFSVGIGWGIFTTLGANLPDSNNLKSDATMVALFDTIAGVLAGFVVIPSAFAAGVDVSAGPRLIFEVMTGVFSSLPGGRIIGIFFFCALIFAVISSLFTFFEIPIRTFEIKLKLGRKKAVLFVSLIIGLGNVVISLGMGAMNWIKLPWPNFQGMQSLTLFDWFDSFTSYVLLPLGCILTCLYVAKIWGWKDYAKELTSDGRDGELTIFNKILIVAVVPLFMLIVLLNVFGVLQ